MEHPRGIATPAETMQHINQAWLTGNIDALAPLVHPDIVMVVPGFAGRVCGRRAFLAGFSDFCQTTQISEFRDYDVEVDTVGTAAVITFRFDMHYERSGQRYRAEGRDLWMFQRGSGRWLAVWRTMLDMQETSST